MGEYDEEARKAGRLEKLGTSNPICLGCKYREWFGFEFHHIAGRQFDRKFGWRFCTRCHADFSKQQWALPKPTSKSPSLQECAGQLCIGIGMVLRPIADTLDECAHKLALDARRRKLKEGSATVEIGYYLEFLAKFLRRVAEVLTDYGSKLLKEIVAVTEGIGS